MPHDHQHQAGGRSVSDRDILVEILAIKLYEHDGQPGIRLTPWMQLVDEDRQIYRNKITSADAPPDLYENE
jgi:hypothetical protein